MSTSGTNATRNAATSAPVATALLPRRRRDLGRGSRTERGRSNATLLTRPRSCDRAHAALVARDDGSRCDADNNGHDEEHHAEPDECGALRAARLAELVRVEGRHRVTRTAQV